MGVDLDSLRAAGDAMAIAAADLHAKRLWRVDPCSRTLGVKLIGYRAIGVPSEVAECAAVIGRSLHYLDAIEDPFVGAIKAIVEGNLRHEALSGLVASISLHEVRSDLHCPAGVGGGSCAALGELVAAIDAQKTSAVVRCLMLIVILKVMGCLRLALMSIHTDRRHPVVRLGVSENLVPKHPCDYFTQTPMCTGRFTRTYDDFSILLSFQVNDLDCVDKFGRRR